MAKKVKPIEPDFWSGRGRYSKTAIKRAVKAAKDAVKDELKCNKKVEGDKND